MKKPFLTLCAMLLITQCCIAVDYNLITIDANGIQKSYKIANVQTVTIDETTATPTFSVNLKDGNAETGGILVTFGNATDVEEYSADKESVNATVYSNGKTIFVSCDKISTISFFNLSGQILGETVNATECKCTVSLPGVYIVALGSQQFKIEVE